MATLYNADNKTKKYLPGMDCEALENPMYSQETHDIGDKYLYNHGTSSLLQPPSCGENECVVLENQAWVIKTDRVGQHYYTKAGDKIYITEIGVDVPAGCIQDDPPNEYCTTHDGRAWIENRDLAVQAKKALLQAEKKRVRDRGVVIDVAGVPVLFDTDAGARVGYAEYALSLLADPDLVIADWKASTDQWVTMTPGLYDRVINAGRQMLTAVFSWQARQEAIVDASATIEDIIAVETEYEPE